MFPGRGLPYHLEDHILGMLSLGDLARASSTTRTFQEVFTRRLDIELKARYDSVLEQFGRERIASIATLIERCLKGEIMDPAFGNWERNDFWMSADGKLHVDDAAFHDEVGIRWRGNNTMFTITSRRDYFPDLFVIRWGTDDRQVWLWISRCSRVITVYTFGSRGHKLLQAVALVRVLLSGEHGPAFRGGGHLVPIYINNY